MLTIRSYQAMALKFDKSGNFITINTLPFKALQPTIEQMPPLFQDRALKKHSVNVFSEWASLPRWRLK